MPTQRTRLKTNAPFDWPVALFGHGWIGLAPHAFDETTSRWHTVLRLGRTAADVVIRARECDLLVELTARRALSRAQIAGARSQLRHMLRLDEDLSPFYRQCRRTPARRWVARRGGGRLLRSPSAFEDLI